VSAARPGEVVVFEVLHDTDGEGPAGDGTVIARFRKQADADRFAKQSTCYGRAISTPVAGSSVPKRLAARWGVS
jgi:hypothetical protein